MKHILILLIIASTARAQDSSKLANYSLQARTIEALVPFIPYSADWDEVMDFWKKEFRRTKPENQSLIKLDTIQTGQAVFLYNMAVINKLGTVAKQLNDVHAPYRSTNKFLDSVLTSIDAENNQSAERIQHLRDQGRRRLLGKNN